MVGGQSVASLCQRGSSWSWLTLLYDSAESLSPPARSTSRSKSCPHSLSTSTSTSNNDVRSKIPWLQDGQWQSGVHVDSPPPTTTHNIYKTVSSRSQNRFPSLSLSLAHLHGLAGSNSYHFLLVRSIQRSLLSGDFQQRCVTACPRIQKNPSPPAREPTPPQDPERHFSRSMLRLVRSSIDATEPILNIYSPHSNGS